MSPASRNGGRRRARPQVVRHPRRSRLELWLARFLQMQQHWRRREDRTVWRVTGVWRLDCQVQLERGAERLLIGFAALRRDFVWIVDTREDQCRNL